MVCKCLDHDAARAAGLASPFAIADPALERFAVLVRNAIVLGSSHGVPTLQALSWMDIETPYDTETTQRLAWMLLRG